MIRNLRTLLPTDRHRAARRGRFLSAALSVAVVLASLTALMATTAPPARAAVPPGFQETTVFSGLINPTVVRFASDGRVFVAEKRGVIKVFDSLTDTSPTVFADLRTNVYNFWDRGLLGMALAPNFPADPYVYVLYTYDAAIGGTAPRWGTPGADNDPCPTPPGPTGDGCVVSGRLSRLQASGNVMTGQEEVFINDWCQQYPSHSTGAVEFGPDGALYASGGDGASFNFVDYGQDGAPVNPCGDPPGGVGAALAPPTAEGGALRSQDLRTGGDPVSLDGTVIRVDPASGAGLPNNPMAASADANARRIIAYGLRNPFRFTVRPGTSELWVGDVGWNEWEEINRILNPTDGTVENFGWPCYEGNNAQSGYQSANLNICTGLYGQPGAHTRPYHAYHHNAKVVADDACQPGSSSIAGLAFEFNSGSSFPAEYDDALFFADYSRDCIWVMKKGADSHPAPGQIRPFVQPAANPVNLEMGPDGNLYYPDFDVGRVQRIRYVGSAPTAVATASPTSGPPPLAVSFDGTGSTDPDGDALTYAWDLDGDGAHDDSTSPRPTYTYTTAGTYTASLQVTDTRNLSDTATVPITVTGNTAPTATITAPATGTTWRVGDVINFSGSATDAQDGNLPASSLSWDLVLHHCPSNCHTHPLQSYPDVATGSFSAPDHEYPSYLELRLTATDSGGLSHTVTRRLDPRTVVLTFSTNPGGLRLVVNGTEGTATFTRTVIVGSTNSISAPSPQTKSRKTYVFASWSDGGVQTHNIVAPATATTYTARFRNR
jgi:glucose/arabinose dehydrogenase